MVLCKLNGGFDSMLELKPTNGFDKSTNGKS